MSCNVLVRRVHSLWYDIVEVFKPKNAVFVMHVRNELDMLVHKGDCHSMHHSFAYVLSRVESSTV